MDERGHLVAMSWMSELRVNQNGGRYRQGKRYDASIRELVEGDIILKDSGAYVISDREIAKRHQVTVSYVRKTRENIGKKLPERGGKRLRKVTQPMEDMAIEIFQRQPSITLLQLQERLYLVFQCKVSTSTLSRLLRGHGHEKWNRPKGQKSSA